VGPLADRQAGPHTDRDVIAYLVVFVASAATAFLATPLVRLLAIRVGAIAHPSDRKVHLRATPTSGGIAMYLGLLAGIGVSRLLPFFSDMDHGSSVPLASLLACTAVVGLGVIDDIKGISALSKFTGQVFSAGVLLLAGVQVAYFWFPGLVGIVVVGSDLAVPLTVLWVVAMLNAVNLIDGLDGLAAGMVAIAAGAFFIYLVHGTTSFADATGAALLSAILGGITLGFLPWNFHPAKIFMGDSGAMLLGMLLAIATISGVARNPYPPSGGDFAVVAIPILLPLLVLAIPLLDVVLAILRRGRRGVAIGNADKEHIHHRLIDIGHSHRQAVLLMYLWSALISGSALAFGLIDGRLASGSIVLAAVLIFAATVLPRLVEHRRRGHGGGPSSNGEAAEPKAAVSDRRA
jgi:UDP-GlcNAc:undecaprenyl-phosphate/decaprenyl-phosphate GlcNAc-1-phosphate transferase